MKSIESLQIESMLIQDVKILDVRAQVEFSQGSIPNSFNIPILNDEERVLVGTCYKKQGREAALNLGHQIVSDDNKKFKVDQWLNIIESHPNVILTCFRGGLRSQIAQSFLAENKVDIPRIHGGYKIIRQIYLDEIKNFAKKENLIQILTGETGSGKTLLIDKIARTRRPCLNLEEHAAHRGSAFGSRPWPQPAQAKFENLIAHELLKYRHSGSIKKILLEDESRLIGSLHLPDELFFKMRESSVVQLVETLENRIENIFKEYVSDDLKIYHSFAVSIEKIQKRLGGLRTSELLKDIEQARLNFTEKNDLSSNKVWIEKILVWYYDPMYQFSFKQRQPYVVFKGNSLEVESYLENY